MHTFYISAALVHILVAEYYRNTLGVIRFLKRLTQFDAAGMHAAG